MPVTCPDCDREDDPAPAETPAWYCPDCGARRDVEIDHIEVDDHKTARL